MKLRLFPRGGREWARTALVAAALVLVGYAFISPWIALFVTRGREGAEGGTFCLASGLYPMVIPGIGDQARRARSIAHEATHVRQGVVHGCVPLNLVKLGWGSDRKVLRFEAEAFCSELIPHLLAGGDPWDVITTAEEVLRTSYGLDHLSEEEVQTTVRGACAGVLGSLRDAALEDSAIDRHLRAIRGRRPASRDRRTTERPGQR